MAYKISSRRDFHQESSSKYQHSVTHTSKSKMGQVERIIKVEKRNSYFNQSVYNNFCLSLSPSNTSDIALAGFPYGNTSFQITLNGEQKLLSSWVCKVHGKLKHLYTCVTARILTEWFFNWVHPIWVVICPIHELLSPLLVLLIHILVLWAYDFCLFALNNYLSSNLWCALMLCYQQGTF